MLKTGVSNCAAGEYQKTVANNDSLISDNYFLKGITSIALSTAYSSFLYRCLHNQNVLRLDFLTLVIDLFTSVAFLSIESLFRMIRNLFQCKEYVIETYFWYEHSIIFGVEWMAMTNVYGTLSSKSIAKLMPKNWLFNDSLRMQCSQCFYFDTKQLFLLKCNLLNTLPSKHQNSNGQNFSLIYIVNI